jgi:hypothetical protein
MNKKSKIKFDSSEKELVKNLGFLPIQIMTTFLGLLYVWLLQYRRSDSNPNLITRFSFQVEDPPWTPPGTTSHAIIGLHHFGDWTLFKAYGQYGDPYNPNLPLPSNIPPVGLSVARFFGIFGNKWSYFIFLLITSCLWIYLIKSCLEANDFLTKITFGFFCILLSSPVLMAFDRGALYPFCFGLLGLGNQLYEKKKYFYGALCLIIAISLKPFLGIVLLWLLRRRDFRLLIKIISLIILTNLLAFYFYSHDIWSGLNNYFHAFVFYNGKSTIGLTEDGASLVGFLSKTNEAFYGTSSATHFVSQLLSINLLFQIIMIVMLSFIVLNQRIPDYQAQIILLGFSSLIISSTQLYSLSWAPLAALLIASSSNLLTSLKRKEKKVIYGFWFLIIVITTPLFAQVPTPSGVVRHNWNTYLYQPILLGLTFLVLANALRDSQISFPRKSKK